MHAEVMEFVREQVNPATHYPLVYDIGGRDINGTPKGLISHDWWRGVDLHPGPGVDVVMDVRDWFPERQSDLTLCLEVLEHARDWRGVLTACLRVTRPGGLIVVTCAAPPRAPHSGLDGGPVREGEHYANIEIDEMGDYLSGKVTNALYRWDKEHGDLHARVSRPV